MTNSESSQLFLKMNAMKYMLISDTPQIHTVPLPELTVAKAQVTLSLDDAEEQRRQFIFSPYQSIRITTQDCFLVSSESGFYRGGVFLVENSPWIVELQAALSQIDHIATFLNQSHHFVVPSGDDIIEVVAWKMEWNGGGSNRSYPSQ